MVGYTRALAAAVWLGTTDGKALVTKNGSYERVRLDLPRPHLAAVHGRGHDGNGAQSGGDRVREPEVRRRNPDTGPIADAGAGTVVGAHLHT